MQFINQRPLKIGDTVHVNNCTDIHPQIVDGSEGRVVGEQDDDGNFLVDFWFTRKRIGIDKIYAVTPKVDLLEQIHEDNLHDGYDDNDYDPFNFDNVNKPKHYNQSKFEPIDVIQEWGGKDQFEGFCWGNVIKYCSRYKHKNGVEDLKKARYYLDKLIGSVENE